MQTSSFWKNKYEELKKLERDRASLPVNEPQEDKQKQLDEQIIINHRLVAENQSLQSQLSLKTNFLTESNTLIKLIEDSLTNGIGDGSINVTNGNALVGNTIKSLKLINDYVSNNNTQIVFEDFSSAEVRLVTETKINHLEQWRQDLNNTNEKIQELLEKQATTSLEEQLKHLQIRPEDQSEENKEKLELVTKSLGELKEMLSTLRGGVSVTNGSALIDNIIENLETINNYITNNYNDYEGMLKELKNQKEKNNKKSSELEKEIIRLNKELGILLGDDEVINEEDLIIIRQKIREWKHELAVSKSFSYEEIQQKISKKEQQLETLKNNYAKDDKKKNNLWNLWWNLWDSNEKQLGNPDKLAEIMEICQTQKELIELKLQLEKQQQYQAEIAINSK